MATINKAVKNPVLVTHEGGLAKRISPKDELRRSVMACMLWENQFYEDGTTIADRIKALIPKVDAYAVADMAVEAREDMKLRHVPLLLVREMARLPTHRGIVAETLERIIQRADELTEFLAIYWKEKRQPLSAQVKRGLARAFTKFESYQLAKYNRDGAVKLRDVMFLTHPKPRTDEQAATWKQLASNTLPAPDTWEVALSGGADKKETFTRLIKEKKLFALALLRNLRNMQGAGVSETLIKNAIENMNVERVLPFRFIAAARYAPMLEPQLEQAMFKCVKEHEKLPGKTVLLIDVSGSMDAPISDKSEMKRVDAACGLGVLLREICEDVVVSTFSNKTVAVPPRRGFALRDAILGSQDHGGTDLGGAVRDINRSTKYDRLIVISDEQSQSALGNPVNGKGYVINVASYRNGVGYGEWNHIDGWSEKVIDYIMELEKWESGLSSNKELK